jgi:predicted ATP-dependent endonuclease of OLD family
LLLPEFANILKRNLEESFVSVVNLQGLMFAPFAKLFDKTLYRIRAVILSDSDPKSSDPEDLPENSISNTAKSLLDLQKDPLIVRLAKRTFEYDLALAGNAKRLAEEYQKLRPKKGAAMFKAVEAANGELAKAEAFFSNFDPDDKGRFAQRLAASLAKRPDGFIVPLYIAEALEYAIDGKVPNASKSNSQVH